MEKITKIFLTTLILSGFVLSPAPFGPSADKVFAEGGAILLPDQCASYGETSTSTCKLNQDLNEGVKITARNFTLDCDSHKITGINKMGYGIYLSETSNVTIKNCAISNFSYGIYLFSSSGNTFSGNTISGNNGGALLAGMEGIGYSRRNNITGNAFDSNGTGITLWWASHLNIISGNTISNSSIGIESVYAQASDISKNSIANNLIGIHLWSSDDSAITDNTIFNSRIYGAWIASTARVNITGNDFLNNRPGLFLQGGDSNKINRNNFKNNLPQVQNVGFDNSFDDGYPAGGNYWSDYVGQDLYSGPNQDQPGSDGMGDAPYAFAGDDSYYPFQDKYPFIRENGWKAPNLDIAVSDGPDPFTPPYQSSAITIGNKSVVPLEKMTLSIEGTDRNWEWLNVYPSADVQAVWDGKDGAGNFVPAGNYNYAATGCLFADCQGSKVTKTGAIAVVYPDFSITAVKPVQVVWDSHVDDNDSIDLVAGKATMVRVEVGMENYEGLNRDTPIKISLTMPSASGGSMVYNIFDKTLGDLELLIDFKNNPGKVIIDYYLDYFFPLGDYTIIAIVDSKDVVESTKENNQKSVDITIKDTQTLKISYFRIKSKWPADYGEPDINSFVLTANKSGTFILGTYPVSENKFINQKNIEELVGNPIPSGGHEIPNWAGFISDLKNLSKLRAIKNAGDRVVGIVSDDYFTYHGLCGECGCTRGLSYLPIADAVLVQEGYPMGTAHEIGHTFGLRQDEEEYRFDKKTCEMIYPGNPAAGFWVNGETEGEIKNSVCFMGAATPDKYRLDNWIESEDYKKLFRSLRNNADDPKDLLLVSGTVFKNGKIELDDLYYLKEGNIEKPERLLANDISIRLIDKEGQTIEKFSFPVNFEVHADPFGIIEIGGAPFVRTLPFPPSTRKIEIQYQDQQAIEFNPTIKLLHDAIDLIPDAGFINDPVQRRKIFHNKIDSLNKMIDNNEFIGAKNKLESDIEDKLKKWLIVEYEIEDPLQFSREEIIELVNTIIERIDLMIE